MGGGPESQINTRNFVQKISHFFKKIKCSKQPKKQNKLNFYFSLSGVPKVRGGWVGSDVWDKVPNKSFFLTPSLSVNLWIMCLFVIYFMNQLYYISRYQLYYVCFFCTVRQLRGNLGGRHEEYCLSKQAGYMLYSVSDINFKSPNKYLQIFQQ